MKAETQMAEKKELYFKPKKYSFVRQSDTHTSKFIEVKKGNKAFICDIKGRLF